MTKPNKTTRTAVRINKSLEKYKDQILFQEKLDKANQILREVGLPKKKPTQTTNA